MREPSDLYIACPNPYRAITVTGDLMRRGIPFDWRPAEGVGRSRIFVVRDNEEHMKYLVAVYDLIPVRCQL